MDYFNQRIPGNNSKNSFFSVNFEHPRVRKILESAKKLYETNPEKIKYIDDILKGEFADGYMDPTNRSIDSPLPETLPGIKLKRPFGKLRAQAERLLGKRLPDDEYDARWEEYDRQWRANHERRKRGDITGPDPRSPEIYETTSSRLWLIGGLIVAILAFSIRILKIKRGVPK